MFDVRRAQIADPKRLQRSASVLGRAHRASQMRIVKDHGAAIAAHLDIDLHHVGAEIDGGIERQTGIFRRDARRPAMSNDQRRRGKLRPAAF